MKLHSKMLLKVILIIIITFYGEKSMVAQQPPSQDSDTSHNSEIIKLLFIHHSVGGHWLAHGNGDLVNELNKHNYYVNDITYGWEPQIISDDFLNTILRKIRTKFGANSEKKIGDKTDIGHMPEWFLGEDANLIMGAAFREDRQTDRFGDHSNMNSSNPIENPDPELENQIVMFKSCYPNTLFKGDANDSPSLNKLAIRDYSANSKHHTISNAKRVFNDLLDYFGNKADKFFVIVTPPPRVELPQNGKIARSFSNWLVKDWLEENDYKLNNIMVFDLFNVLTSGHDGGLSDFGDVNGNHHRLWKGEIQHTVQTENNILFYPKAKNNNHPSPAGLQKATKEFVPLLNHYVKIWKENL